MKAIVIQTLYGCDTGCEGHAVIAGGKEIHFEFGGPYKQSVREYAEELIAAVAKQKNLDLELDWENSNVDSFLEKG